MKNILLVDDEIIYLKSLSEGLRMINKDYNVMLAENGERAIKNPEVRQSRSPFDGSKDACDGRF